MFEPHIYTTISCILESGNAIISAMSVPLQLFGRVVAVVGVCPTLG
jgi:hypothetical protein